MRGHSWPWGHTIRRAVLSVVALGATMALPSMASTQASSVHKLTVLRIGYQRFGDLNVLKARGTLEKSLAPLGITVRWTLFPAGPQLLEGLNVGSIDLGTTGEAPPIFAQAAGAPLVYVATEPPAPAGEAILVPQNSPIHTVADLKGKKVAFNKGSNVHYLLVQALAKAHVRDSDIQPIYLVPADARAAFERGSVEAWVIWDPYFAVEQQAAKVRVLADGTDLVANRQVYLASRTLAYEHTGVVKIVIKQLQSADGWANGHIQQVASYLAPQIGIASGPLTATLHRARFGATLIDDKVIANQQRIADTFFRLGLIPSHINVKDAEWKLR